MAALLDLLRSAPPVQQQSTLAQLAQAPMPRPDPRPGMLNTPQPWQRISLPPDQEQKFQNDFRGSQFYNEFQQRYGEQPDLNGDYDYRLWWQSTGINPSRHQDGTLHGPSKTPDGRWLKSPNHPTAWMENFWNLTGQNPEELGLRSVEDAQAYIRQRGNMR